MELIDPFSIPRHSDVDETKTRRNHYPKSRRSHYQSGRGKEIPAHKHTKASK